MTGWTDGQDADLKTAAEAIAKLLGASRQPLFIVDAIDLAGAVAAVELARKSKAVLDTAEPTNVRLMQEHGWLATVQGEASLRSDMVLIAGPLSSALTNDEAFRKLAGSGRPVVYVGPKGDAPSLDNLTVADSGNAPVFEVLGALRGLVAGRPIRNAGAELSAVAEKLKTAKYGVATFATGQLDEITGVALSGLIEELSAETRWTLLPLGAPPGQGEMLRMCMSLSRVPPPLSYARSTPRHDAWLYSARTMLSQGEADAAVWISASERPIPDWVTQASKLVVISAHRQPLRGVACQAEIGVAGVDYAAILEPPELGAFTALTPASGSSRASAAEVLRTITLKLTGMEVGA